NVNATTGCSWTASTNDAWVTITAGSMGKGNGTVSYSVAANTGGDRTGTLTVAGRTFTITQTDAVQTKVGAYNAGYWTLDQNGNFAWDGTSVDKVIFWNLGQAGETPVYGDWNGSGRTKIGLYINGIWLLDYNGNGVWDGPGIDKLVYFGGPGYTPVVGD